MPSTFPSQSPTSSHAHTMDHRSPKKSISTWHQYDVDALATSVRDALYDILCGSFEGYTREHFEQKILRRLGQTKVTVFYGEGGQIAGFFSVGLKHYRLGDENHALFDVAMVMDLNYRAGLELARVSLGHAMEYKLRHPHHRVAAVIKNASPIAYRLIARYAPRLYPYPGRETPASINTLMKRFVTQAGYHHDPGDPWLVRVAECARFSQLGRLQAWQRRRDCAFSEFFVQRNPHFDEGDILLTFVPLDFGNVSGGLWNTVRQRVASQVHRGSRWLQTTPARLHNPASSSY